MSWVGLDGNVLQPLHSPYWDLSIRLKHKKTMDWKDNIFLRAAFGGGGRIEMPASPRTSTSSTTSSSTETSKWTRKGKSLRKRNAPHRKYTKLEDRLIIRAVELNGRDWRAVLAFLKRNWEVLGEKGELYRDCDIGDRSIQDRLRKRAATVLSKDSKAKDR